MEIINKKISELKPYENNPRKNNEAVEFVANSIKDILIIGLSTTIIETVIALCDTPFLYLSKRIK